MDFQMYIRQLYDQMYLQHQELSELRSLVTQLSAEVKQLKEKPSVTVERLEYKFDQLKVETLEGTLNIGLNPTDLNAIEDLAVPPKPHSKNIQMENPSFREGLSERLLHYVNHELEKVIRDTEMQTGVVLEPSHINLIQEDISKQLPARTEHYFHYFRSNNDGIAEDELEEKLYKTITEDINQAVHAFITQMPHQRKE